MNNPTVKICEQCGNVKDIVYTHTVFTTASGAGTSALPPLTLCMGHPAKTEEKRYFPGLFAPEDKGRTMQELLLDALSTDEMHHKQWYLWRIAEALEIDTSPLDFIDKGIAP